MLLTPYRGRLSGFTGRRALFGEVGSPAPTLKKEPPGGPAPVGVPAGEPTWDPGAPLAEKLKLGTAAPAAGLAAALLLPNANG